MATVGELLKEERIKQELELEDIEKETSIRIRYLACIENGDYASLPGDVYAKGFIRNYAKLLGFDGTDFVEKYKAETENSDIFQKNNKSEVKTSENRKYVNNSTKANTSTIRKVRIVPMAIFIIILIAFLVAGIYFITSLFSSEDSSNSQNTSVKPAIFNTSQNDNTEQGSNTNNNSSAISITSDNKGNILVSSSNTKKEIEQVELTLSFSDKSWANLIADGKEVFTGIIEKDEKQLWTFKNTFLVKLGNASAVQLFINDIKLDPLGVKGEVVERKITILR